MPLGCVSVGGREYKRGGERGRGGEGFLGDIVDGGWVQPTRRGRLGYFPPWRRSVGGGFWILLSWVAPASPRPGSGRGGGPGDGCSGRVGEDDARLKL